MKDEELDWVLSRRMYRLIMVPVWAKMTVGVRAKKYPLSNSYNTSIDKKQHREKANMSNPHSEYDEGELKRMIQAREMKVAKLQGENKRLKGELDQCLDRMRKLQRQLMNGDVCITSGRRE